MPLTITKLDQYAECHVLFVVLSSVVFMNVVAPKEKLFVFLQFSLGASEGRIRTLNFRIIRRLLYHQHQHCCPLFHKLFKLKKCNFKKFKFKRSDGDRDSNKRLLLCFDDLRQRTDRYAGFELKKVFFFFGLSKRGSGYVVCRNASLWNLKLTKMF